MQAPPLNYLIVKQSSQAVLVQAQPVHFAGEKLETVRGRPLETGEVARTCREATGTTFKKASRGGDSGSQRVFVEP